MKFIWLPYFKTFTFLVGKYQFLIGFLNTKWLIENQQGGMDMNMITDRFQKDLSEKRPHRKEKNAGDIRH